MSSQLDLLERDLSAMLYSVRGMMGNVQKRLERIERLQDFIVKYRCKVESTPSKTKVVQMDISELI